MEVDSDTETKAVDSNAVNIIALNATKEEDRSDEV